VGKGKRVDVYLEVRKRRGHIFLNETQVPVQETHWLKEINAFNVE
jgi:hypothetical protein